MRFRLLQLLNAQVPMRLTPFPMVRLSRWPQPLNDHIVMVVTLSGMVKCPLLRVGHCSTLVLFLSNNTPSTEEYVLLPSSTTMLVRFSQSRKAALPIEVTLAGMVTLVSSAQPGKE